MGNQQLRSAPARCTARRHALFFWATFCRDVARWETYGDEAIRAEIAAQKMPNGRFSSCILSHDCDLFGRVEAAS
jgi:hypothetical protein